MKPSGERGFTLVETVVVVAIIGIVVVPLLSMFTTGLTTTRSSRQLLIASYIAQEKVEEIIAVEPTDRAALPEVVKQSLPSDPGYTYSRSVSSSGQDLLKVTVQVYWPEPRGERSYKVVTLLASK